MADGGEGNERKAALQDTFEEARLKIIESGFPDDFGAYFLKIGLGKLLNYLHPQHNCPFSLGLPPFVRPEDVPPNKRATRTQHSAVEPPKYQVGTPEARAALDDQWRRYLALTPSMRTLFQDKLAEFTDYVRARRAEARRQQT